MINDIILAGTLQLFLTKNDDMPEKLKSMYTARMSEEFKHFVHCEDEDVLP